MSISDEDFEKLLAASSLGTPEAQRLIAETPPDVARRLREAVQAEAARRAAQEDQN
ncbi:hypothetical protein AB0E81_11535 [Streptomyces sp. NPDC033538]|uniref:hypothetical protein n=1 Tax=Streptomyces sp. NPDC033538 TaxID=3155367 RepID=UPI0033D8210B